MMMAGRLSGLGLSSSVVVWTIRRRRAAQIIVIYKATLYDVQRDIIQVNALSARHEHILSQNNQAWVTLIL
jgi:hypothetical protein